MKRLLLALCLLFLAVMMFGTDYVPGNIVFKSNVEIKVTQSTPLVTNQTWFNNLISTYGITQVHLIGENLIPSQYLDSHRYYVIMFDIKEDVDDVVATFQNQQAVVIAQPNYIAEAVAVPNDEYYPQQWGLQRIDMEDAWDVETGDPSVIVAVLDTGIDIGRENLNNPHPDLLNNIWQDASGHYGFNAGFMHNGDDIYNTQDYFGHGTHVSGIISATNNDLIGVASVAGGWGFNNQGCRIMPVRCNDTGGINMGSFPTDALIHGLIFAYQNGAKVINMSLRGLGDNPLLHEWVQVLYNDVFNNGFSPLIVAAAGNDHNSNFCWPAFWDEVISVAATDVDDIKCDFSNYSTAVDICSPGGHNNPEDTMIISTLPCDDEFFLHFIANCQPCYDFLQGTSMAAPHVAGLAGLILSHYPNISSQELRHWILGCSDDVQALNQDYIGKLGSGRINAFAALTQEAHPCITLDKFLIDNANTPVLPIGTEVPFSVFLKNWWLPVNDLHGTLTTSDTDVSIMMENGSIQFGNITTEETINNSSDLFIRVDRGFN